MIGKLLDRITIDPMKIPRPERSGYFAVFFVYLAMWAYGEYFMLHDYAVNLRDFSLVCWFAPWECPKAEKEQQPVKDFHVTVLYPGKGKKKVCSCHQDMRARYTKNGKPIQGWDFYYHYPSYVTCDSDGTTPRTWLTAYEYKSGPYAIVYDYRWHCE